MVIKQTTELQIPFHDIDILQIAWHGHYLKYFELGRTRLMQELKLDWPDLKEAGISMPVVEAHLNFRRPLLYQSRVVVEARIEEWAYPELKVLYSIRESTEQSLSAEGWTRQIYYSLADGQGLFEVPAFVRQRLEAYSR